MKTAKPLLALSAAAAAALIAAPALAHPPGPAMFERIDQDKSGRISRTEAETASLRMFARLDADNDGALDAADREAMMAKWAGPGADRPPADAPPPGGPFADADADKDGAVTLDEFKARTAARFAAADADRSGDLDEKEFAAFQPGPPHHKGKAGAHR